MESHPYSALPFEVACELLGVPPSTMEALIAAHHGPRVFKIGRRRFVSHEAMNAWLRGLEETAK